MSPEGAPTPPETFRALLVERSPAFRIALPGEVSALLGGYLAELDRWRRTMDLTGNLSAPDLCDHALESLLGSSWLPPDASVLDIGSGAGFPGVPLAVFRPDLRVAALEPRGKRAEFLRHVARAVPVLNLRVIPERLEEQGAEKWDAATVRAVGELPGKVGRGEFLRPGGILLAWTTDAEGLRRGLEPGFTMEGLGPVPGSRSRAIAAFRKPGEDRGVAAAHPMFPVEHSR